MISLSKCLRSWAIGESKILFDEIIVLVLNCIDQDDNRILMNETENLYGCISFNVHIEFVYQILVLRNNDLMSFILL